MQIEIRVDNIGQKMFVEQGCSLQDLLTMIYPQHEADKFVAAYVNNRTHELTYCLFASKSIRFIELESTEGRRIYARSVFFLLQKAVLDILGAQSVLRMMHPIGRGYYAQIVDRQVTPDEIVRIKERMNQLVASDSLIVKTKVEMAEGIKIFKSQGFYDKQMLIETRPRYWVSLYNMCGLYGYFYGAMVTSTAKLKVFDLQPFGDGIAVLLPSKADITQVEPLIESNQLFRVFQQSQAWIDILGIPTIGELNGRILGGGGSEIIKIGEAMQEKNISDLADTICDAHRSSGVKLVLIAGPSSSGKTTFAKRLSIQLSVLGIEPQKISLDDYFVPRAQTPRDANGDYDFESLQAIDVEYFNRDLSTLLGGGEVVLPKFNFIEGRRDSSGISMRLNSRSIIIVEGIHALNPALTPSVERSSTFKIYASALTALSIDNTSAIHTTDSRLIRRLVRDYRYRGRSAYETLSGWASVRRGEDLHIFPYQEQADVMFNTSLVFEFSVLKEYAAPLLASVPANTEQYAEAIRLSNFLNYFTPLHCGELPPTSILREFVGDSSFEY